MPDLADLTALDLGHAYRTGDCSPPEVLEAVRARIEQWEPTINAVYYRDTRPLTSRRPPPRSAGGPANR
jgi:aspartyl-tRNA(Asn)/glutamyl-tRNA(Gln) amidotransferase subunit A